MKPATLPRTIDPLKLAKSGTHLVGSLAVKELSRLQDLILDNSAQINITLNSELDYKRRVVVLGEIQATLKLTCQRCLKPMDYFFDIELKLSPVTTDAAAELLPTEFDPLMLDEKGMVELSTMIEDELLLAWPLAPYHEQCNI